MSKTVDVSEDATIIMRCQNGDKEAFGLIVKKYMQRAYYTALGIVGTHDGALDLSQEAFVRAYRSIKKVDPKRNFYTWYYQILRNLCFNFIRDKARHARSFSEIGETSIQRLQDQQKDALEIVEQEDLKERMWTAINELKDNEREIIILKDFQDLSYKEIAATLNCPIGTVMSRLFNARKSLKKKLEKYL
jgi:RNA polymerase sigma-70 factor (ECF subfamily)